MGSEMCIRDSPIVDFVLFGYRKIALDTAFGVKKLDFCPGFNEAIGYLKLWLEFPGRDAFLLYSQELG